MSDRISFRTFVQRGDALPLLGNSGFTFLIGIEEAAAAHRYQVVLSSYCRDPDRELAIVNDFQMRRMDGIITGQEILLGVLEKGRKEGEA